MRLLKHFARRTGFPRPPSKEGMLCEMAPAWNELGFSRTSPICSALPDWMCLSLGSAALEGSAGALLSVYQPPAMMTLARVVWALRRSAAP